MPPSSTSTRLRQTRYRPSGSRLSVFTPVGSAARLHTCGARRQGGTLGGYSRRHIRLTHLRAVTAWSSNAYRRFSPKGVVLRVIIALGLRAPSRWASHCDSVSACSSPSHCMIAQRLGPSGLASERPHSPRDYVAAGCTSHLRRTVSAVRAATYRSANAQSRIALRPRARACRPAWQ